MKIRPITEQDFPAFKKLASEAGIGFTSLPADDRVLMRRVECAQASFRGELDISLTDYLFVLEMPSGELGGCCAIAGAVGVETPLYHYRKTSSIRQSKALNSTSQIELLHFSNELIGKTEICTLLLSERVRGLGVGALLSKSRFLFMAEFLNYFAPQCIAEMRGFVDVDGVPPFWDAVAKHFFGSSFLTVNRLAGSGDKSFMSEMVLSYPIYLNMLPEHVRATVGTVQSDTLPAVRLLQAEGFHYSDYIDVVDGGPVLIAETAMIRAIRESFICHVECSEANTDKAHLENYAANKHHYWLIANRKKEHFRCILSTAIPENGVCKLSAHEVEQLGVEDGASIRVVKMTPS